MALNWGVRMAGGGLWPAGAFGRSEVVCHFLPLRDLQFHSGVWNVEDLISLKGTRGLTSRGRVVSSQGWWPGSANHKVLSLTGKH